MMRPKACPSIREISALLFPRGSKERLLVVLHAFLDESGTHKQAHTLTVAGYVSTLDQWEAFATKWLRSLDIYKVKSWHQTDFLASEEQFKGWIAPKKFYRLHRLIDIINQHVLGSFSVTVPLALYHEMTTTKRTVVQSPYQLAALHIFSQVSNWADKSRIPRSRRVVYAFESGADGAGHVLTAHRTALKDVRLREKFRLIAIAFSDKKHVVQLQPADILAHTVNRDVARNLRVATKTSSAWDAEILVHLSTKKTMWEYLTRKDLAHVIGMLHSISDQRKEKR